jgi:hypothetical protein
MPGPHDFAVRSDLNQIVDRPCAANRSFSRGVEAPFVRAPVDRSRETPPCDHHARQRCRVHRTPTRVRDDARPPLCGWDGSGCSHGSGGRKQEYFPGWDWTGQITLKSQEKIARLRMAAGWFVGHLLPAARHRDARPTPYRRRLATATRSDCRRHCHRFHQRRERHRHQALQQLRHDRHVAEVRTRPGVRGPVAGPPPKRCRQSYRPARRQAERELCGEAMTTPFAL